MKVWIDQDLCTGDGLCEEIAPDVFTLLDDGLAYVVEGDKIFAEAKGNPQGAEGLAEIPTASSRPSSSPPRSAPASASTSSPDRARSPLDVTTPGESAGGRSRPGAPSRARNTVTGPEPGGVGAHRVDGCQPIRS